jgi:hypothetical protein
MSGKTITAIAAVILIGSTALASAQTRVFPRDRYWGNDGYNDGYYDTVYPPYTFGLSIAPGYYDYAPGYYAPGYYAPGYNYGWTNNPQWGSGW